jgi:hypothetical protein
VSIEISLTEVGAAERVADKLTYRHPGIVSRDDIISELTLWMLQHEDQVRRLRERGHGLPTALFREGQRYINRERAQAYGYDPRDQYQYSMAQVRDLLSELVISSRRDEDGIPYLEVPTNESGTRRDVSPSNGSDPAFGGNRLVMLIDVHAGLERLSPAMNARLREAVAEAWDEGVLAATWDVSQKAAALRVTRGLRKLSQALSEIRADVEYTGTREVVSNSKARWAIRVGASAPKARSSLWREGSGVLS